MSAHSTTAAFRTLDGLRLVGTLVTPDIPVTSAALLVHGGGVTREEGGFFTRLAAGLAEAGITSLRYDLRGHGKSDGRPEESSLAVHLNDIQVARQNLAEAAGVGTTSLIGASFGGGLTAYYAAKRPDEVARLVLLNPQLEYKSRYIDHMPHWKNGFLNEEASAQLHEVGYLGHSATVKHSRAFLNEVFWIRPNEVISEITSPTLIVHGTEDTLVPIDTSRRAARRFEVEHRLVEIEGAQHGFAVHDDPRYLNPQSQEWQAFVIATVRDWLVTSP